MARFLKLSSCSITEDGDIISFDLYINPFQIESFIESDLKYTDSIGTSISTPCISIVTKTGSEHCILMKINEFRNLVE